MYHLWCAIALGKRFAITHIRKTRPEILKVNIAALDVQAFVTVALEPADPVLTVPIAIVAALPAGP